MGDRVNISVKDDSNERVYFYGHWAGERAPETVRAALARGEGRWDDPAYLARIIFCELVKGDEMQLTGYGISTAPLDNEYPIIVVDCAAQQVYAENDTRKGFEILIKGNAPRISFAEYAALLRADWQILAPSGWS